MISPGKLKHMKALSNKDGIIAAAAMDQRGSLKKSIASAKGADPKTITDEMMSEFDRSDAVSTPASTILPIPNGFRRQASARAAPSLRPMKHLRNKARAFPVSAACLVKRIVDGRAIKT
jgi:tagatose-1,6-bisphosphate aldolase